MRILPLRAYGIVAVPGLKMLGNVSVKVIPVRSVVPLLMSVSWYWSVSPLLVTILADGLYDFLISRSVRGMSMTCPVAVAVLLAVKSSPDSNTLAVLVKLVPTG